MFLFCCVKGWMISVSVNPLLNPIYALRMPNKHILQTNRFTVNTFQMYNDIGECRRTDTDNISSREYGVQIVMRQAKIFNGKGRLVLSSLPYRVGAGKQMSAPAVTVDELYYSKFFENAFGNSVGGVLFAIFQTKVKSLKKGAPTGLYAIWVNEVLVVKLCKMCRMGCI